MQPLNILIAQHDAVVAALLASSLDRHFRSVRLTHSFDELQSTLPRVRPDLVVADLETVKLSEVEQLAREYRVPFICTHRLPDERMWAEALAAGAVDVVQDSDAAGILDALRRNRRAHSTAA